MNALKEPAKSRAVKQPLLPGSQTSSTTDALTLNSKGKHTKDSLLVRANMILGFLDMRNMIGVTSKEIDYHPKKIGFVIVRPISPMLTCI